MSCSNYDHFYSITFLNSTTVLFSLNDVKIFLLPYLFSFFLKYKLRRGDVLLIVKCINSQEGSFFIFQTVSIGMCLQNWNTTVFLTPKGLQNLKKTLIRNIYHPRFSLRYEKVKPQKLHRPQPDPRVTFEYSYS